MSALRARQIGQSARRLVSRTTPAGRQADKPTSRQADKLFRVYVVKLRPRSLKRPGRREVYVGSSSERPLKRLQKHRFGEHGSRHVARYGVGLLPQLYEHLGPFRSRLEAKRAERKLASRLRGLGYLVYGACDPSDTPSWTPKKGRTARAKNEPMARWLGKKLC